MANEFTYNSLVEQLIEQKKLPHKHIIGLLFKPSDGHVVDASPSIWPMLQQTDSVYEADTFIGSLHQVLEHLMPGDTPLFFPRIETDAFSQTKGVFDYTFYAEIIGGEPYIFCTVLNTTDQAHYLYQVQIERNQALIEKELSELRQVKKQNQEEIQQQILLIQQRQNLAEAEKQRMIDSLSYAQRIQEAMLPSESTLQQFPFPFFVFWQPCELISGDFYFMQHTPHYTYIALGDCTGHGVPGGILSSIGIMGLRQSLVLNPAITSEELLSLLDQNIHALFDHTQGNQQKLVRDGIDIAILRIDYQQRCIEYAGAGIPLYLLREGKVYTYAPQQSGINSIFNLSRQYSSTRIDYQSMDEVILSSDGFTDQIGFNSGRRYKKSRFIKLIERLYQKPFNQHKRYLEEAFYQWKGNQPQTDDVLVLGIQLL